MSKARRGGHAAERPRAGCLGQRQLVGATVAVQHGLEQPPPLARWDGWRLPVLHEGEHIDGQAVEKGRELPALPVTEQRRDHCGSFVITILPTERCPARNGFLCGDNGFLCDDFDCWISKWRW